MAETHASGMRKSTPLFKPSSLTQTFDGPRPMSGGKSAEARMGELRAKIGHRDGLKGQLLEREREEMEEPKA